MWCRNICVHDSVWSWCHSSGTCGNFTWEYSNRTWRHTLAKKIVTVEKFMRLIYSSIMWCRAISSFGSTSTRRADSARRELATQIEVDVAWYHMIALRINLMNISAVTIFLARIVLHAHDVTTSVYTIWDVRNVSRTWHNICVYHLPETGQETSEEYFILFAHEWNVDTVGRGNSDGRHKPTNQRRSFLNTDNKKKNSHIPLFEQKNKEHTAERRISFAVFLLHSDHQTYLSENIET